MTKSTKPDVSHPQHRALCGILNVDKPPGLTSHDVVVAIRRLSGQRKVGHAGTLDPMATGVLLVCLGQATRVTQYLVISPKTYHAAVRLGISTTTHDAEGEITCETKVNATRKEVEAALQQFAGRIGQVPPMYSAIKRDGKRLYELARQGITVKVPPREVDIYGIHITEWAPPTVHVDVQCGPGTYIRALARDLGEALGCGAHLASLRRMQSGQFTVEDAVTLEQLDESFAAGTEAEFLHPLDAAFHRLPTLHLSAEMARRLVMGQQVKGTGDLGESTQARAYAPDGRFIALVSRDVKAGSWQPHKVFAQLEDITPQNQ